MNDLQKLDHAWAIERLTAFSIGMLPEDDTVKLEEHLAGCDACRARLDSVRAISATAAAHLPASLIATWARSARLLGETERSFIESHLAACEACRATLQFAGHEPVLPARLVTGPARVVRPVARSSARGWALGFSTIAAAAAVWLLVVQPKLLPHDARTSATMGPVGPVGPAGAVGPVGSQPAPEVSIEVTVPPATPGTLLLPDFAAGEPNLAPITETGPITAGAGLVLRLPESVRASIPREGSRDVTLVLLRGGRELGTLHSRLYSLGDALRLRPHRTLAPGEYQLQLTIATDEPGVAPDVLTFPLRVR